MPTRFSSTETSYDISRSLTVDYGYRKLLIRSLGISTCYHCYDLYRAATCQSPFSTTVAAVVRMVKLCRELILSPVFDFLDNHRKEEIGRGSFLKIFSESLVRYSKIFRVHFSFSIGYFSSFTLSSIHMIHFKLIFSKQIQITRLIFISENYQCHYG